MTDTTGAASAPSGPPRAVAEYWHAEALRRLDDGIVPWSAVAHVTAAILAAMDAEAAADPISKDGS